MLAKRKYNRGKRVPQRWVFRGCERESGKVFMVEVPDRSRATLENMVQRFILPGSHIVSDGWASYANLDQIQGGIYSHSTIVHERSDINLKSQENILK